MCCGSVTERWWKAEKHAKPWIIQLRQGCFLEIMSRQISAGEAGKSAPNIHAIMTCIINTFGSRLLQQKASTLRSWRIPSILCEPSGFRSN